MSTNVKKSSRLSREADTRLLLHVQHAANEQRYRSIIVSSEDTDVRILCLAFSFSIQHWKNSPRHWPGCVQSTTSLHAFMRCDAVSAFAGIGKVKPLKRLLRKKEYQRTFQQLGENWLMSEDLLMQLEAFVCDMYGSKNGISDVNQCRYSVFCAKKGNNNNNEYNNNNKLY